MKKTSIPKLSKSLQNCNIAIAHEFLLRYGGAERMVEAWSEIFPRAKIYTLFHDPKNMKFFHTKVPQKIIRTSFLQKYYQLLGGKIARFLPFISDAHQLICFWFSRGVESFDFSEYDIVISSSTAYMHGIKTGKDTLHISYIHSPNRYIWDYVHQYGKGWPRWMQYLFHKWANKERTWDMEASKRADLVVAAATEPQRRIARFHRRESTVIYPYADLDFWTPATGKIVGDYFLIYGQFTEYKRFDLAISAANRMGFKLVVIGHGKLEKMLQNLCGPSIEFLGPKYGEELREYVQNCRAFLFPGPEDFGMTAIEVMACGRPVIALQKNGAIDTIKEGVSGEFFEEETVESLEKGMAKFMANEVKYQPKKIRKHAEQFSLKRFQKEFIEFTEKSYRAFKK
jgi:glycosyltransferase involved in cell wall biosynthesis